VNKKGIQNREPIYHARIQESETDHQFSQLNVRKQELARLTEQYQAIVSKVNMQKHLNSVMETRFELAGTDERQVGELNVHRKKHISTTAQGFADQLFQQDQTRLVAHLRPSDTLFNDRMPDSSGFAL